MVSKSTRCHKCGRLTNGSSEIYEDGHWNIVCGACYKRRLSKALTSLVPAYINGLYALRKVEPRRKPKPDHTNQINLNL